jgi:heme/copper-type cytochrome/quinol oxidase subunit 4
MLHQTLHAHKKQFYTVLAEMAVGFISLGSFIFWNSFYVDNTATTLFGVALKLSQIAGPLFGFFGDFIVALQYINLMLFTGQAFSQINVKFVELVHLYSQSPSTARVASTVTFRSVSTITSPKPVGLQLRDQVSAVVDIHNKLLDTVPSINSAYSLQILFIVARAFVHITFSLYFFLVTLSRESVALYRVHTLFLCLWNSIQLILIITCCDYTKRQVSMD